MGGIIRKGQMRIGIFVITYNAARHIQQTLARIPEVVWNNVSVVYVIDDCSTDDTVEIARAFNGGKGKLVVMRNRGNQRYGGNQKKGWQYAIDHALDVAVMLHGDGQYAPESLPEMIKPIREGRADVVIGSRMLQKRNALRGRMPFYKFFGNIVLTKVQNALCKTAFSEYHSGYRAYNVAFLKKIPFWENTDEWHFDTQILLQAKEAEARIVELPIPTYYGDEKCHVPGMAYAGACIRTAIAYFFYRSGLFYSRVFDVGSGVSRYREKFSDPYSSHTLIWAFLAQVGVQGKDVLELGVGDAALTCRVAGAGARIDGIEIDDTSVELARGWCKNVYTSDLDDFDWARIRKPYDIVLAADVLEHLKDAEKILASLKSVVSQQGYLVVSIPNVANLYVRINLMFGRFPYHTKGILDRTHLRFYTGKSAARALRKTGWVIEQTLVTQIPFAIVFPFLQKRGWRFIMRCGYKLTCVLKGLLAYQYVFICRNPNDPFIDRASTL